MLAKPKKDWIGTYHHIYGKLQDREYEVKQGHENEPMWEKAKKTRIKNDE